MKAIRPGWVAASVKVNRGNGFTVKLELTREEVIALVRALEAGGEKSADIHASVRNALRKFSVFSLNDLDL